MNSCWFRILKDNLRVIKHQFLNQILKKNTTFWVVKKTLELKKKPSEILERFTIKRCIKTIEAS